MTEITSSINLRVRLWKINHSGPGCRFYEFYEWLIRAVMKSRGPGISPGYYECGPWLLLLENRRKIEPKEIPCCLIPRLLVVFTWQLEILVTSLGIFSSKTLVSI